MSGDEQALRDALRARAEHVDAVDDFVGPSVRLARRRTRRAAAGVVTAAVLVVGGVTVATWATTSTPPMPRPVPATATTVPPAPSPSPTPTASAPSPSSTPSATGDPAASDVVPWAAGSTVHLGSSTVEVGGGRTISAFWPLAGGAVVVGTDPGSPGPLRWRIHNRSGDELTDLGRMGAVVASRDGRLVAVQRDADGAVTVRDARGRRVGSMTLRGRLVAVADGWVWASGQQGGATGWEVGTGTTRTVDARLVAVSADGRRGAATTGPDDNGPGCWQVVDLTKRAAPVLVERCGDANPEGFTPQEFSADGRLLIGHDDADGGFYSRLVLARVSDGSVLVGRSTDGERVDGWTWALAPDGESILFSRNVSEPRSPATRNDLARCSLSLQCQRVEDRVRLEEVAVPAPVYVVGRPLLDQG